jgi:CO dehydrogenase/acetyl-CoA synthase alpha subunit
MENYVIQIDIKTEEGKKKLKELLERNYIITFKGNLADEIQDLNAKK